VSLRSGVTLLVLTVFMGASVACGKRGPLSLPPAPLADIGFVEIES